MKKINSESNLRRHRDKNWACVKSFNKIIRKKKILELDKKINGTLIYVH